MKEKLVFIVHGTDTMAGELVRLDREALEILRSVQRETGLPAKRIASDMIRFCADKYEVVGV